MTRRAFVNENGLLLGGFLAVVDFWRSYASPLQHPALMKPRPGQPPSNPGGRRDILYLASLALSIVVFIAETCFNSVLLRTVLVGVALYRSVDILVALSRIAVVGEYGTVPTCGLRPAKVQRNTLAVLINYIELVFWYGTMFFAIGVDRPIEFTLPTPITPALALILSFSTMTTIGYGNIAPQGMISAVLCWIQALTAVVLLACVIGSLVGRAASGSQSESAADSGLPHPAEPRREPTRLTPKPAIWLIQRIITLAVFTVVAYAIIAASAGST